MRMKKLRVACLVLSCVVSGAPIWAHHSFAAEYDRDKPVTITGVLTLIEWANPHTHFYLDVKDKDGKVANWKIEGYAPNILYRSGFRKDVTIKVGDTITISGWQARDGTNWGQGREMTLSDGTKYWCGPGGGVLDAPPAPTKEGGNK